MLSLLDKLLQQVLMDGFKSLGSSLKKDQVKFEPPDDTWRGSLTEDTLNVYLVDMRENRKLRSNERSRENHNGVVIEEPAPARMDCHYLISAFSTAEPQLEPTLDEHTLLYAVAAVLHARGVIKSVTSLSQQYPRTKSMGSFSECGLANGCGAGRGFSETRRVLGHDGS